MLAESPPNISQRKDPLLPFRKGDSLDDVHLWQNVKRDNELAFSVLYRKYTQRLYNYGMHSCHDHDLVMDCLQELFVSIWDKRKNLTTVHSVSSYLFKSFRRLLMKKLSWRKRFLQTLEANQEKYFEVILPVEALIEKGEDQEEQSERIRRSLVALTKRQREAIFLRFYNDLSYSDIASIMELQVDSVYNIISKAIDSLRQKLKTFVFSGLITILLILQ
jgi:RNA polymerase sigma factor (sigma-70 family)